MAIFRAWVGVAALGLWGCTAERGTGGSGLQPLPAAPVAPARSEGSAVFADSALGFEIVRPSEGWQLDASSERTTEGLAIPVVLRHRDSGAQVVLQVAPAVATPTQLAERLNAGLRSQPGFTSGERAKHIVLDLRAAAGDVPQADFVDLALQGVVAGGIENDPAKGEHRV